MKTILIYYSFSGKTKKLAEKTADKENIDIIEIKEVKKRGKLSAFFSGCPKAVGQKASKIQPPEIDLNQYEKIILMAPVWAGNPAPAFNAVIEMLLENKDIDVILTAGSGECGCKEKLSALIESKKCSLSGFETVKA